MLKSIVKTSIFALLLFSFMLTLQSYSKKDSKGFLPKELNELYFGMSYADFVKETGVSDIDSDDGFRWVVIAPGNSDVNQYIYYFDGEGNQPLYEVIIDYKLASTRDQQAKKLLGNPNSGEEWLFNRTGKNKFDIKAWTYMNKLVIVGVLPGTEWDGE